MSVIYVYIKATSTQPGGIVLVEASPAAVRAIAELGQPTALELKAIVDTSGNAQSGVDYLKSAIGNDLAGTIKTIGSVAAGLAVGEMVAVGVAAGVAVFISLPYALLVGAIVGVTVGGAAGQKIYDDGWDAAYKLGQAISPAVNTSTKAFLSYQYPEPPPPPRDPLVLDLDGGGISITYMSVGSYVSATAPIYFDMDADGIRTGMSWIKSGEAIVVRDLNGNGLIDSGRELFGDETILTQGSRAGQRALNGFQAIADLDSNLDGKFDASDAAFASVKLWKDLNQNGVSEAGELFSFASLGVQGIGTAYSSTVVNLGGQNQQLASGTFTRGTGATGLAASLLLETNPFFSEFASNPALTIPAKGSTQMNGSGWVRDLREAMSLGTPEAAILQAKVNAFAAVTTQAAQRALLGEVVTAWGNTATLQGAVNASPSKYDYRFWLNGYDEQGPADLGGVFGAALDAKGFNWRAVSAGNSSRGEILGRMLVDAGLIKGYLVEQVNTSSSRELYTWTISVSEAFAQNAPALSNQIHTIEAFNAQRFLDRFVVSTGTMTNGISVPTPQASLLDDAYATLKETVYAGLVTQTRLKPYLDSISVVIDSTGVRFDSAAAVALIRLSR